MKQEKPNERKQSSADDTKRLMDAIEDFELVDSERLLLDTAMGYKSRAMHKNYNGYTDDSLVNESLDQMIVLKFLLIIHEFKSNNNGYLPNFN